jgi:hypothetical protein
MKSFSARRQFLQGSLATCCAWCLPTAAAEAAKSAVKCYCAYGDAVVSDPKDLIELKHAATEKLKVLLQNRSTAILDYLAAEDKLIPDFFGSTAPIYYDPGTTVAAYMNYTRIDSAFVALGEGFITQYASQRMLRVAGLLAHEQSHFYQVRSGVNHGLTDLKDFRIKHVELHADYMAGAYLAWREKIRPQSPAWWLEDLFAELPASPENYSSYHGSPKDRREAFFQGRTDFPRLRVRGGPPADAAALQGLKYIQVVLRS